MDKPVLAVIAKYHNKLVTALEDMLSTEECVCESAELKKGACSVCAYEKLLNRIDKELKKAKSVGHV